MEVSTSSELQPLGEVSISNMIEELQQECQLERHLPGGGYLHMSDELPYLVIYRMKNEDDDEDRATVRFVLSEASFLIIGTKDFEGYQRLMFCLAEAMASKFKSFLMLEIYAGEQDSNKFVIRGPSEKLPSILDMFRKELDDLNRSYEVLNLSPSEIEDTEDRQARGQRALLDIPQLKDAGGLLLGLEIPPVYRNRRGEEYPVFFRSFKNDLIVALHKTIFEFIRIQTTSGVSSYRALGQKKLQEKVLEIDKRLEAIETSYQFLWLVSPSNIRQIKDIFFESNYEKVLNFHYRLLPIDPDVLKRELYNLKMEDIDDPAFSFIFREKREELDKQITMLHDRGSSDFFYNSLMLFRGIEDSLHQEALQLLNEVPEEDYKEAENVMKAADFKILAEKEFDFFREQDPAFTSKVHIRDDVNILMVSRGELYIPSDYKMNATETQALIQHEVGTHILTYYNGMQQPLKQLSIGLTDYDTLQEGLAVMSEYFVGGLTANRLRTLAGRVVAATARMHGKDFKEIFKLLHEEHQFSAHRAFNITSRIMQGGGFTKDIIYLKGLVELKKHLEEGCELEPLFIGKFAMEHMPIITELRERRVLKEINLYPRYLKSEETKKKLSKIREGISLSQMINA